MLAITQHSREYAEERSGSLLNQDRRDGGGYHMNADECTSLQGSASRDLGSGA